MKKKVTVIVNPKSGTFLKKIALRSTIENSIDEEKFDMQYFTTEFKGHASEITKQAVKDGADYVVAVGGDGTINEVASSLVNTKTALCIVPVGSGNGLARHLQIPMAVGNALSMLKEELVCEIDYCKANDQIFFCTCGVGFDAQVSFKFANDKFRGSLGYLKRMITEYLSYKPEEYTLLDENGEIQERAFLVTCANASQWGNDAYIAPKANVQDGLLDIAILKPFTPLDVPQIALQIFTKTIEQNSKFSIIKKKRIVIERANEGIMHIDGEPIHMGKRIEVTVFPKGLKVLVPKVKVPYIIEPIHYTFQNILQIMREDLGIRI